MNRKGIIICGLAIIAIVVFVALVQKSSHNRDTNDVQISDNTTVNTIKGKFSFDDRVVKGATYDPSGASYKSRVEVPTCPEMFTHYDETTCDTCYELHVDNEGEKLRYFFEVTVKPTLVALQTVYFTESFECRPESIARASGGTTWETYTLTLDESGATLHYTTSPASTN